MWNTNLTREKSPEVEVSQEEKVHQEGHLKEAEKNPGSVESEWIEPARERLTKLQEGKGG